MGRVRCPSTTGAPSPVPSAARGGSTRMSATISNAFRRNLRARPRTVVTRAIPTRAKARGVFNDNAKVKAKSNAKAEDAKAMTRRTRTKTRTGTRTSPGGNPNPTQGGDPKPCGWHPNQGPTTRSQTQAQREQGTKPSNEDGYESNTRKRSCFMRMAPKLRNKGFDVTCPAEV